MNNDHATKGPATETLSLIAQLYSLQPHPGPDRPGTYGFSYGPPDSWRTGFATWEAAKKCQDALREVGYTVFSEIHCSQHTETKPA